MSKILTSVGYHYTPSAFSQKPTFRISFENQFHKQPKRGFSPKSDNKKKLKKTKRNQIKKSPYR